MTCAFPPRRSPRVPCRAPASGLPPAGGSAAGTSAGRRYRCAPGWRAEIAILGTRESKTFSTKAEAGAWASERETEIRRGADSGIVVGKSCGDAFDRYLEEVSIHKRGERWERLRLNAIGEVLIGGQKIKDIKLANVTPELLGVWRDQRMTGESKVTGATVNRELNLLSHVFTTARKEWKWLAGSPTSDVRRPKPAASRERIPTEDEIERLCNALGFAGEPVTTKSQAVAVAYLFAIETAMRAGEICGLMPAWINGAVAGLRRGTTVRHYHSLARCPVPQSA